MNPSPRPVRVSVIDPISPAIERVKHVLFRPFDLKRWFIIGFSAFLATLGESAGGGNPGGMGSSNRQNQNSFNEVWDQAVTYVNNNLAWLIPVAVLLLMVMVAAFLLVLWLSSRGRFMFLDNVATNQAEVVRPWNQFRGPANSLFRFRLGLILLGFLLTLPFLGIAAASTFNMLRSDAATAIGVTVAVTTFAVALLLGIALLIVGKFTTDFAIPVMWRRATDWRTGWREFGRLLRANVGRFVLYLLFYIVVAIAIGALILAVVLLTCCVAGCILAIPYLGTVFALPIHVFLRSYSAYYLAQYGPEFDVFQTGNPGATPT
ncbi:MAG TPA: hypothetical protein PLX89_17450 [Verrucomicrobiota bacterium]|nr:hypothetical protein [Verrucomicrobiales bacterium]HRI14785.1 hypothetical protein [Verrucomicrobiota bacterium]